MLSYISPAYAEAPAQDFFIVDWINVRIEPLAHDERLFSCVKYVRSLGLPIPPIQTPKDLEPNSEPRPGAAILLDYNLAHIALVTSYKEGEVCFTESNFKEGKITNRCLPEDAEEIRGFWYPG